MYKTTYLQQPPIRLPRRNMGTHTEFEYTRPMHFHAGAWERGNSFLNFSNVLYYAAINNITATLSARMSNAQPWRFFYGSIYKQEHPLWK